MLETEINFNPMDNRRKPIIRPISYSTQEPLEPNNSTKKLKDIGIPEIVRPGPYPNPISGPRCMSGPRLVPEPRCMSGPRLVPEPRCMSGPRLVPEPRRVSGPRLVPEPRHIQDPHRNLHTDQVCKSSDCVKTTRCVSDNSDIDPKIYLPPHLQIFLRPDEKLRIQRDSAIIDLFPHQIKHFYSLLNIFENGKYAFDLSELGSGKTFTACAIAIVLNLPLFVTCSSTVCSVWERVTNEYNIEVIDIISYESLRSIRGHQPRNGYLIRHDTNIVENQYAPSTGKNILNKRKKKVTFSPSNKLLDHIESGILVVIDEIQNTKNRGAEKTIACHTLTKAVIRLQGDNASSSKLLDLSGAPIDKEEQAETLLRSLDIITHPQLCMEHKGSRQTFLYGLKELIDYCMTLSSERTTQVLDNYPMITTPIAKRIVFKLFVDVVIGAVSSSMHMPDIKSTKDAKNGFYRIDSRSHHKLVRAVEELRRITEFDSETQRVASNLPLKDITKALVASDCSKINTLVRLSQQSLESGQNGSLPKVVLFINYLRCPCDDHVLDENETAEVVKHFGDIVYKTGRDWNHIWYIVHRLQQYNPVVLVGGIRAADRGKRIKQFQEDPMTRVMIANLHIGSEGISLDDTIGNEPRYVFVIPNYHLLRCHQASNRTTRVETKSDVVVRFVYGQGDAAIELSILTALFKKSNTVKETVKSQVESGVIFPGDYPSEVEGEMDEQSYFGEPSLKQLNSL